MSKHADDNGDNRQIPRDSLFVMARLRLDGSTTEHRVRVRNLSAGGLMAEGNVSVVTGAGLEIEVRNFGWVAGTVAWVQDNRFGIAFRKEIDALAVRTPAPVEDNTDALVRRPLAVRGALAPDPRRLRQI